MHWVDLLTSKASGSTCRLFAAGVALQLAYLGHLMLQHLPHCSAIASAQRLTAAVLLLAQILGRTPLLAGYGS